MSGRVMKAVQYDGYGGGVAALKHVEVPVPCPRKDEVLIKVEAASLNPVDWKIQKGQLRPLFPRKFPHIPELSFNGTTMNIAGEVVEVGKGVQSLKAGDKVVAQLSHLFAVAKESLTAVRTPEVSALEAVGLPVACLTAHQALTRSAGLKLEGEPTDHQKQVNVLVTAASGGVGHYAVQLAKLGNAYVTATCGAWNIELVKSLGADEVIDYKTPEGSSLKSPSGRKYDVVVHCTTGIPWSTFEPSLGPHGKVINITPRPASLMTCALKKLTFSKKSIVPLMLITTRENLQLLVRLVKEGKLKTVVDSKHPLTEAEAACGKSIDGHATGKIIVEP